jgi:hypothetical protein
MREVRREIDIEAPPAAVWAVLSDTRSYSEWNPFVPRLSGELREGAKLDVRIEPPGGRAMTFKPTVLGVEPDRELRWLGRLLLPGVFDGEHILHIERLDQTRSRFTQAERFSGILVRLFSSTLDKTELGFEQMNAALKTRAERRFELESN